MAFQLIPNTGWFQLPVFCRSHSERVLTLDSEHTWSLGLIILLWAFLISIQHLENHRRHITLPVNSMCSKPPRNGACLCKADLHSVTELMVENVCTFLDVIPSVWARVCQSESKWCSRYLVREKQSSQGEPRHRATPQEDTMLVHVALINTQESYLKREMFLLFSGIVGWQCWF